MQDASHSMGQDYKTIWKVWKVGQVHEILYLGQLIRCGGGDRSPGSGGQVCPGVSLQG